MGWPLFFLAGGGGWPVQAAVWLAVFALGWWAAGRAEAELGVHDAPQVVIDEVSGYLTAVFLAPNQPATWILGFILFRFFDILKPWPVNWVDLQVPGGFGVMADDILAGLYAWLVLRLVLASGWF